VNLNEDPVDALSSRITNLEDAVTTQLNELRHEVGMAAAAMRGGTNPNAFLEGLEQQLAHAVSASLSSALESIRTSLTEIVSERMTAAGGDVELIAANLQHAVLLALSAFEQAVAPPTTSNGDPLAAPATARDVARINARIDELRTQLLG
jgi:hypothetical protein